LEEVENKIYAAREGGEVMKITLLRQKPRPFTPDWLGHYRDLLSPRQECERFEYAVQHQLRQAVRLPATPRNKQ